MLNVVCVWWGDKYPYSYVERLQRMVEKNLTLPYSFLCVSHDQLDPYDVEGVWNKLALFDLFKKDTTLFFDLDVVIQNNIDDVVDSPCDPLAVINGIWKDVDPNNKQDSPLNSSIMLWKGDQSHIWKQFESDADRYMCTYRGMDSFLFHENVSYQYLPEQIIYSRIGGRDPTRDFHEWVLGQDGFNIQCYYYPEYKVCLFNGDTDDNHYKGFEHYWA